MEKHLSDSGARINKPDWHKPRALPDQSDNDAFGAARNPWSLEFTVDGSSGSSVAAGSVPIAYGSDSAALSAATKNRACDNPYPRAELVEAPGGNV
ncbi:MAG: amidase family protein [Halioglobus sp.]|nr:amidase family protein [Halioglobus sp.]